ncbi:MAG: alpha amylase C-terminal domain-containing protein, partial [Verrucomicrobiota bacterium]
WCCIDRHDDRFSFDTATNESDEAVLGVSVVNATPVPREGYRLGVPDTGFYEEILNSDSELYGGANVGSGGGIPTNEHEAHGRPQSIQVSIPPLGTVIFKKRAV